MEDFNVKTKNGSEGMITSEPQDFEVQDNYFPLVNPKSKFGSVLLHIVLLLWMLPQNIVGLLFAAFTGWRYVGRVGGALIFRKGSSTSVTLGHFIFIGDAAWGKVSIASHEYGHHINSRWSGWFYLLIIGLPSAIACMFVTDHDKYHKFFPEKWAEKFGRMYFPTEDFINMMNDLGYRTF